MTYINLFDVGGMKYEKSAEERLQDLALHSLPGIETLQNLFEAVKVIEAMFALKFPFYCRIVLFWGHCLL